MESNRPKRPKLALTPVLILSLGVLSAALFLVIGKSVWRGGKQPTRAAETDEDDRRSGRRHPSWSAPERDYAWPASTDEQTARSTARMNQTKHKADLVMKEIRSRIASRAPMRQPIEAQVNNITDYLRGAFATIRAIDPSVFAAFREDYEKQLCGSEPMRDIDILLYAKLVAIQSDVASPNALNCALERHRAEDVVTWALLDAWNASGRAPLPALASVERQARDDRTTSRLMSQEPSSELKDAARTQGRMVRQIRDPMPSKATHAENPQ